MEIIEILGLTVEKLKEKLLDCNQQIIGTKAELQCRMIEYYQHSTVQEEECSVMTTETELNDKQRCCYPKFRAQLFYYFEYY